MKKSVRIVLFIIGSILIGLIGVLGYFLLVTSNVKLDYNKFVNLSHTITYYDDSNEVFAEKSNGVEVVGILEIPKHTQNAFIAIEDKRFYMHNGIDGKRLLGALINNVKSFSFKEGGSTITQQLIKNTHLSGEKTINRKLAEIKLARQLEKKASKEEILEKYLNTIYFGDNCYGIASASKHYFNKLPSQLTLNESAILAGIIKSPTKYSPTKNADNCFERKNLVLKVMYNQGLISEFEYNENIKNAVDANVLSGKKLYDATYFSSKEIANLIEKSPYSRNNIEVYTTINTKHQNYLKDVINDYSSEYEKSAILLDKNSNVLAYASTVGDVYRQMGSVLKPLSVYLPAIEHDVVNSFSLINDEKTDFCGYSPSNYNDKYFGEISVKEALEKSSNTVAVKILNSLGVNKSVNYLQKLNFKISDGDRALTLALGATEKGGTLSSVTSAYSVFLNNGSYNKSTSINNVVINGSIQNVRKNIKSKVFSDDSTYIVADMLQGVVKNGTAKKLSSLPFTLYAKTGTVGAKDGNTDTYALSFTNDYILGVWVGAKDGKKLPNNITGGSVPTLISKTIWENVYKDKPYPDEITMPNSAQKIQIDKISFDNDGEIILADEIAPKRFVKEVLIKKSLVPKTVSTRFSSPEIEKPNLSFNNNQILIRLCQTQYINIEVNKINNGKKIAVFDSEREKSTTFIDDDILPDQIYDYYAIPYFVDVNRIKHYGKEIYIGTIKTPRINLGENWWDNDMN